MPAVGSRPASTGRVVDGLLIKGAYVESGMTSHITVLDPPNASGAGEMHRGEDGVSFDPRERGDE